MLPSLMFRRCPKAAPCRMGRRCRLPPGGIRENCHYQIRSGKISRLYLWLQRKVRAAHRTSQSDLFLQVVRNPPDSLAQKIHKKEDAEALFCYKHVVQSVFAERRKASACPTITQHSVCCFPRYSPSPW